MPCKGLIKTLFVSLCKPLPHCIHRLFDGTTNETSARLRAAKIAYPDRNSTFPICKKHEIEGKERKI